MDLETVTSKSKKCLHNIYNDNWSISQPNKQPQQKLSEQQQGKEIDMTVRVCTLREYIKTLILRV